jgi:putative ABC transport system substrate-binding protein
VAKAADKQRLPIFGFESSQAKHGAVLVLARDYFDAGREGALVAARVMRGESPAAIPFTNLKTVRLIVNLRQAQKLNLPLPSPLLHRADEVIR